MIDYKKKKITNKILVIITLVIITALVGIKAINHLGLGQKVVLQTGEELLSLDEKENAIVGINNKQIFKITGNGINTYDFNKMDIWSDTFTMNNVAMKQKDPYLIVGDKKGNTLNLYDHKGKKCQITTAHPIVNFSVNEKGGIAVIEKGENSYIITAYDSAGKKLCWRVSYPESEGYPTAAILSPDNKILLMSYVSVDEPQVNSRILAMHVEDNASEKPDNILFGYVEKNNLIYQLDYISKDVWVAVGDKMVTWYDNTGNIREKMQDLILAYVPQIMNTSEFTTNYLPIVVSEKPIQNIVHRQDRLVYYDDEGKEIYSVSLDGGVENYNVGEEGVTLSVNGVYRGYNKLCNEQFEYTPSIEIKKVIYLASKQKGIAVSKDKVYLVTPKKGDK